MTTPAEQTIYTWVSDGSASYTIPMWIYQLTDISVFYNGAKQDPADYSVSAITEDDFSLTLSSPPVAGVTITVARDVIVTAPDDFAPGAPLTAEDLNYKFDVNYIIENDSQYYGNNIFPKYSVTDLVSPTDPLGPEDVLLPKLSTPGPTDSARVWGKDSTGAIIDLPLDPAGISAAELKAELAVNTSAVGSGATLVGYFSSSIGATTVQDALDTIDDPATIAHYTAATGKVVIANQLQDSAAIAGSWAIVEVPSSVGTFATETVFGDGTSTGDATMFTFIGGTHIKLNTAGTGGGSSTYPDGVASWGQGSPNPPIPATGITDTALATKGYVYNTETTLQAQIAAITASLYPVGRIISIFGGAAGHAGLPVIDHYFKVPSCHGDAYTDLETFGSAASGADYASDVYEALFLHMWETGAYIAGPFNYTTHNGWFVVGGAGASAQADWDAGKTLYLQGPWGSSTLGTTEQMTNMGNTPYTWQNAMYYKVEPTFSGFPQTLLWPYICLGYTP